MSSALKIARRLVVGEVARALPCPRPVMVSATREISWRTERSRSGVPTAPRKYFWTTTLVAVWLQLLGTSTSRCSKTHLAALAGDGGGAQLPLDAGEAVVAGGGEVASQLEAAGGCRCVDEALPPASVLLPRRDGACAVKGD